MRKDKLDALTRAGWQSGTGDEFLGLTSEESALLDLKEALGNHLRCLRLAAGSTQTELAQSIGSSQSRVAKMESGDPGVSMDLLVKALLAMGASRADIASALGGQLDARAAARGRGKCE